MLVLPPPEASSPEEFGLQALSGKGVRTVELHTFEGFAERDPQVPGNALLIEDPVAIGAVLYMEGHFAHESAERIKAIEDSYRWLFNLRPRA